MYGKQERTTRIDKRNDYDLVKRKLETNLLYRNIFGIQKIKK
jgi:hypothetical protein